MKTLFKNIPNILTSIRILLTPFIIYFAAINNLTISIILIIIASITDMLDGLIARSFNLTSALGAKLDTVADKLFAGCIIISLILKNKLFILCLTGEILITIINLISFFKNKKPHTEYIGKVKTTILFITLILQFISLLYCNFQTSVNIMIIISFIFQIISFVVYIKYYLKTKKA